ncbi:MAG: alpha/beta fold hydrolase [Chloroflexota bacterium]|nr:alpha/beta fold hydrolase [Chloroflexota bacterium]
MRLKVLKVISGVLAGPPLLMVLGSVIGETVATMPPVLFRNTPLLLDEWHIPYENVAFPTPDGLMLRGWFVPAAEPDAPAIVYAPSTANDQRSGLSLVPTFHAAGYHVLLFSYRGHARSDGNRWGFTYGATESIDVDAAVKFLYETRGIYRIGAIGHSVGAVSIILSAARNPCIGAVVAVAPFNNLEEVWTTNIPSIVPPFVSNLMLRMSERRKGFRREDVHPLQVVGHIAPRPLLFIHGTEDRRISVAQVRRLFAAAQAPSTLWLVEGATHASIRNRALDALAQDVVVFFDVALRTPGPRLTEPQVLRLVADPVNGRGWTFEVAPDGT